MTTGKRILNTFLFLFIFFSATSIVHASSVYVLPYPSYMPGSKLYTIHLISEKALQYWYFGDFGQFEYNLQESDKYLVEAKTLFEYKQYLLGYAALEKSNRFYKSILPNLESAEKNGKDTSGKKTKLKSAREKHKETLIKMKKELPEEFVWTPEKSSQTILKLHEVIDEAVLVRASL